MECAVTWMSTPGFRRTRYGNGNASRLAVYKPLVLWTAGRPITLASHHPINMTREAHEQVLVIHLQLRFTSGTNGFMI